MSYVGRVLTVMIDCIEQSLDSLVVVKGKQVLYVMEIVVFFLALSVFCEVYDISCFISWQEALVAVILTGLLCSVNYVNKVRIEQVLGFINFKNRKKGEKNVEQQCIDGNGCCGGDNTSTPE